MAKLFLQDSPNDCGPACLATILNGYGRFVTPVDLSCNMEFTRGGASNREMVRMAELHNLEGRTIQLPIDQFSRLTEPVIAYTQHPGQDASHMVVIFKVKGKKLHIGDPGRGKRWVNAADFEELYKGFLIIFRLLPEFQKGRISEPYTRKFYRFIGQWRSPIFKSLLLGLLASAVGFGSIYLSKYFVDNVIVSGDYSLIAGFAAVFVLARVFNLLLDGFNSIFTVRIRKRIQEVMATRFFNHVVDLEKRHIDNREGADFLQKFVQIEGLTQGMATYFSGFFLVCFGMLVKMGLLIWLYDGTLIALILGVVLVNTSLGFVFANATAEHANRQGLLETQINTTLLSSMEDIRVVRTFNARDWLRENYRYMLDESLTLTEKITALHVYGRSFSRGFNALGEAAIFLVCGYRIMEGTYTLGDFLVFLTFAQSLSAESAAFPGLIQNFQNYLRVFARQQAVEELSLEKSGPHMTGEQDLEVAFDNVSFGYNKEMPVLKNVSFTLKPGQTTAIVGESGSGKTTITNLLMGFYKPDSGRILINGRNIEDVNLDDYRRRLSAVFQSTPIFDKNIYNNITLGNPDISREKVKNVAVTLGIDKLIEKMPEGYDYLIYPGVLSGGQTQRIGIMRAMCKPFDLLLMDEATSHLDSLTEECIVNGIESLSKGKGRVIVAHRLSTVIGADQILVIQDGALVESGNHEVLMAAQGHYSCLVKGQFEVNQPRETRLWEAVPA